MKVVRIALVVCLGIFLGLSVLSGMAMAVEKKEAAASAAMAADKAPAPLKAADSENSAESKAKKGLPQEVNINTADSKQLVALPGIGPKTAEAIVAYRQDNGKFKNIEELTKVKGIGDKTLEKIRPYLQAL